MKKLLYIVSIMLLGAVACTKEAEKSVDKGLVSESKGMVAVTMGLRVPVDVMAQTRGATDYRDHLPKIDAIRVAVFGTSSYPQAYELANPVSKSYTTEGEPVYGPGAYASTNDEIYYFKVLLPVYEGKAIVHIVANGDESIDFLDGSEYSIMSKMITKEDVGGYWASVVLEDGILAQTSADGIMKTDDDGNFIPSDETARLFEDLVLVRNFAEITLSVAPNAGISDVSWALVNDPVSGSIAPMAGTKFISNYKDFIFDTKTGRMVRCEMIPDPDDPTKEIPKRDADGNLVQIYETYNGYMVSTDLNTLPTSETDLNWNDVSESHFAYERVDPNKTNPTYIMMKGKYGNDSDYTYYRVDLMDENVGGYFPLYRNYMYQIDIALVGNKGASTFVEAARRNSGGNVSMSAETKTLTDVSDGFSRMYVEFVEKTFTTGGQKSFWVYYVPDVSKDADGDGFADVDNRSIEVSVKEMGTALADATITKDATKSVDTGTGARWWFNVNLNGQDDEKDLISVLEVKANNGKTGTAKSTIYRDITLKVMKKMDMALSLQPAVLPEGTDKMTVLHIALSDTLQGSMFPLEFYIEDTNRTLNPTGKDGAGKSVSVPVKLGTCLYDNTNTNSYAFVRTVNWDEYVPMRDAWIAAKEAGQSTDGIIDFTTQLKTVEEQSATTIYVDNEYFNMDSIDLDCAEFGVSTTSSTVGYQAGTATVTVSTGDNISWTATVDNGGGLTRAAGETTIQGKGTQDFTLNFDANTEAVEKVYTVTVSAEGLSDVTTTITQRRAPASPVTFNSSDFRNSTADAEDGYMTVTFAGGFSINDDNLYGNGRNNRTITFSPKNGATITKIVLTYTNKDNTTDTSPSFNVGECVRSGAYVTWTGRSASAITYTCGARYSRISSIEVTYE